MPCLIADGFKSLRSDFDDATTGGSIGLSQQRSDAPIEGKKETTKGAEDKKKRENTSCPIFSASQAV